MLGHLVDVIVSRIVYAPVINFLDSARRTVVCLQELDHNLLHFLKWALCLDCDLRNALNMAEQMNRLD